MSDPKPERKTRKPTRKSTPKKPSPAIESEPAVAPAPSGQVAPATESVPAEAAAPKSVPPAEPVPTAEPAFSVSPSAEDTLLSGEKFPPVAKPASPEDGTPEPQRELPEPAASTTEVEPSASAAPEFEPAAETAAVTSGVMVEPFSRQPTSAELAAPESVTAAPVDTLAVEPATPKSASAAVEPAAAEPATPEFAPAADPAPSEPTLAAAEPLAPESAAAEPATLGSPAPEAVPAAPEATPAAAEPVFAEAALAAPEPVGSEPLIPEPGPAAASAVQELATSEFEPTAPAESVFAEAALAVASEAGTAEPATPEPPAPEAVPAAPEATPAAAEPAFAEAALAAAEPAVSEPLIPEPGPAAASAVQEPAVSELDPTAPEAVPAAPEATPAAAEPAFAEAALAAAEPVASEPPIPEPGPAAAPAAQEPAVSEAAPIPAEPAIPQPELAASVPGPAVSEAKRVVVTGATGLIGKKLCTCLTQAGYQVIVFSRDPQKARQSIPNASGYIPWSPTVQGNWVHALDSVYGVVHLAGAPIFGQRWDDVYKKELRDSRIQGTHALVDALAALEHKPAVFVSGSAVGYYGHRDDTQLDEAATPGDDFLAQVCVAWEQEAHRAEELGIRTVIIRTGIVLDDREGALPQLKLPFQFFAGGPILPGTQWFSWIHVDDIVGIIMLALENEHVHGPINATAPAPQTNRDFTATLGKVLGTPSWLPVPGFSLKILLGELADNLVEGQRVIPKKALDMGYQFQYPTSEQALRQLLKR